MSTTIPCITEYSYVGGRFVFRHPSTFNSAGLGKTAVRIGLVIALICLGMLAHPSSAWAPPGSPTSVKAIFHQPDDPVVAASSAIKAEVSIQPQPQSLSIAAPPGVAPGLKAPPSKYSIKRAAAYILTVNSSLSLDEAERFAQHVVDASQEYDLSPAVLLALIKVESRFDPDARSSRGALGLTQVIPKWHPERVASLRQTLATYSIYEPRLNIYLGAAVLRMFWDSTGNLQEALLRYNGSALDKTKAYSRMVMEEAYKAKSFLTSSSTKVGPI